MKRWCCTNGDCDNNLQWGLCPEVKQPLKSDCDKVGYSSIDGGKNCYNHYTNQVLVYKVVGMASFFNCGTILGPN